MFIGEYNHTIDAKSRLIIPQKFREALGDVFYMSKNLDGGLDLRTKEEWETFATKLISIPDTRANARKIKNFFFSGAAECELDKQGRALVAPELRKYAGLEKEVVLTGAFNKVQVWSKSKWDEINSISIDEIEDIAESLAELGIDL